MRVCRLTASGVEQAHRWLDQVEQDGRGSVPRELLEGDLATPLGTSLSLDRKVFPTRFEWAVYAEQLLRPLPPSEVQGDTGLWAWLTLALFDQVCPPDASGNRRIRQRARYIPVAGDFRTYYRHYLSGPWRVAHAHRDDVGRVAGVLTGALHQPGEIAEQLTSRQDLVSSRTVMALATLLYLDPATHRPRRGSGSAGPGTPRRLAEVLAQLDVTQDIYGMDVARLLGLLPGEFARFRDRPGRP